MINEILQWMVIIWLIWSTNNLGKAITSISDCITEMTNLELDRHIDKFLKKPKKSFAVRMKEELKKDV